MPDQTYEELQTRMAAGYDRVREFVFAAVDDDSRAPLDDWKDAVSDAASEIDRIVERGAHPDDVAHARSAMSLLAGIWLTAEEVDGIYLGGEEP